MAARHSNLSSQSLETFLLKHHGYKIGKKIGQGSFSDVHLAEYDKSNEKLVCKIYKGRKITKIYLTNFLPRELKFMKRLKHPNIVETHSILKINSDYFIFMKYEVNGDLFDFINKHGYVDEQMGRKWFHQMAKGLKYLHDLEIAHRDLKLENVLITAEGNLKLSDLGFARSCCDEDGNQVFSRTFCGSPAYAAPEIISSVPYRPKKADVWALGIILFIMLNGAMPYHSSNVRKIFNSQMQQEWKRSPRLKRGLSSAVINILGSMLEPDFTKRTTVDSILVHYWVAHYVHEPSAKHDKHKNTEHSDEHQNIERSEEHQNIESSDELQNNEPSNKPLNTEPSNKPLDTESSDKHQNTEPIDVLLNAELS